MPAVTLTTDFGTRDAYVGAMKGVILSRCPGATVVDIAHDLPAHDIVSAALTVSASCPHFPAGTIHVVVVDPGVGSPRPALALRIGEHVYVGPDNGVFERVIARFGVAECVRLENPAHRRAEVSRTFHGRDIFAPAAAAIARGVALAELGPPATVSVRSNLPQAERFETGRIVGSILCVDRFGNLITDIPAGWLDGVPRNEPGVISARMGPLVLDRLCGTYADAGAGEALALIGSFDLLELAANGASLAAMTGATPGSGLEVFVSPTQTDLL